MGTRGIAPSRFSGFESDTGLKLNCGKEEEQGIAIRGGIA
jgi:hypothetical protein